DHVTQGIPHEAVFEIELAQGATLTIEWPGRRELFGEARRALNFSVQRSLIDEQEIVHDFVRGFAQTAEREIVADGTALFPVDGVADLPAPARQKIDHAHLMFEGHEGHDIAVGREIGSGAEPATERLRIAMETVRRGPRILRIPLKPLSAVP